MKTIKYLMKILNYNILFIILDMAFFIGNSFCKLCQNNEENLQNELLFCSNGLRTKGLFPPFKSFHSTRLPNSNKIWITSFNQK